ncbi:MAG: tRNA (adenosine(37)-N6)-threonylcarbamoyltransferase complex transferase subunit TsaD [Kiritimatiellae bacterium]|nr:tRNA (adenosine(37)-N6)-threonylcarbamoyltransferase complex transferase subunit TsaD [Kiritimatiellia bacterium]
MNPEPRTVKPQPRILNPILGIETSCDETSAGVVSDGINVLSNIVFSQIADHTPYGGVVPEIAARSHVEVLSSVIEEALSVSESTWTDIQAIAVTRGPGLASSLLVGVSAAKAIALRLCKPFIGVNHLRAHLHSIFLNQPSFFEEFRSRKTGPILILLVSGGHTCLVRLTGVNESELLGQTLDDAAGEALDKGARLLDLSYPGGPAIEKAAKGGNPYSISFPFVPKLKTGSMTGSLNPDFCFSFSGLKTALRYYVQNHPEQGDLKDVCASYQEAVFNMLMDRTTHVLQKEKQITTLACVGGVARNQLLRSKLKMLADQSGVDLVLTESEFCTDNAAMIAGLGGVCAESGCGANIHMDIDPSLGVNDF